MPRPPLLCSIIPSSAARARWVTATIAVGTFLSQSAPAQTAAAAAPGAPLEEVVVTAEKRDSTVQKTPISMTAITGDQLAAEGISSVEAVAAETPGISMRSAGPGQTEYEMRGVPSSGGSSPTVGFYLDETPLTAPAAALNGKVTIDPDLFDLNRIEVLRGPQGTLYGASSMGGTIKLVTNQPKLDKMEAAAQTTLSDTTGGGFNYGGSGMLNLPLVDHIAALRVVVTGKYNDGFIDYKVLSPFPIGPGGDCGFGSCVRGDVANAPVVKDTERANWERLQGERVSLLLQPTDALSLDVMAMHQDMRMGGFDQVDIPPGPDVALAHYQPFALAEPYYDKFTLYSATLNYSLDFAQLTSATAYWSRVSSFTGDNSEALQSQFAGFLGVTEMLPEAYSETDQSRQLTEELRLASTGSGPLKWLVGGYFANFSSTW
jgi:iron complex outermembrane receptor protein